MTGNGKTERPSNALEKIVLRALHEVRAELEAVAGGLPENITVERVLATARAELARRRDLRECDPFSVARAVAEAALYGLPIGVGHYAYLVPYRVRGVPVAQLVIGYRGLLELARRSGEVAVIDAQLIRDGDYYRCRLGTDPVIEHEPRLGEGETIGVYAWARLRGGLLVVEQMGRAEVERIRAAVDPDGRSTPWRDHWGEMARKTVLRRLCKRLPLGLLEAAALDRDADTIAPARDVVDEPPALVARSSRAALAAAVSAVSAAAADASAAAGGEGATDAAPRRRAVDVVTADGEVWSSCSSPAAWWEAYRALVAQAPSEARSGIVAANAAALRRVAAHIPEAVAELAALEVIEEERQGGREGGEE